MGSTAFQCRSERNQVNGHGQPDYLRPSSRIDNDNIIKSCWGLLRTSGLRNISGGHLRFDWAGARPPGPPFQIHIHQCPDCGRATVATSKGELLVGQDVINRALCDSQVDEPGKRNTATIPPAVRRKVLARDRHCCRAPGCEHTKFLEVHHLTPRDFGGGNDPENLITLCSACHRLVHEKPGLRESVSTQPAGDR